MLVAGLMVGASQAQSVSPKPTQAMASPSKAFLHGYNLPSTGVALEGYCPVAYFAVNKPIMGKPEFASTHEGVTYHFVSADAKEAFEKSPEKFLPAYGGWCALGMAEQQRFPVDPRNFKIVDGRLMLFLANQDIDALKLWNEGNERELVSKADTFWKSAKQ